MQEREGTGLGIFHTAIVSRTNRLNFNILIRTSEHSVSLAQRHHKSNIFWPFGKFSKKVNEGSSKKELVSLIRQKDLRQEIFRHYSVYIWRKSTQKAYIYYQSCIQYFIGQFSFTFYSSLIVILLLIFILLILFPYPLHFTS